MESSYFHNTSTGFGSYDRYFERVPHYESADFFVCSLHDGIGDTMYNNAYPESIIKKAKEGKVKLLFDCEVANHNYQVLLDQEKVSADHRDIHDQLKLIASNNLYK